MVVHRGLTLYRLHKQSNEGPLLLAYSQRLKRKLFHSRPLLEHSTERLPDHTDGWFTPSMNVRMVNARTTLWVGLSPARIRRCLVIAAITTNAYTYLYRLLVDGSVLQ